MNLPTILIGLLVLTAFLAVVARGVYNKKHGKGGCSCSGECGGCCHCK